MTSSNSLRTFVLAGAGALLSGANRSGRADPDASFDDEIDGRSDHHRSALGRRLARRRLRLSRRWLGLPRRLGLSRLRLSRPRLRCGRRRGRRRRNRAERLLRRLWRVLRWLLWRLSRLWLWLPGRIVLRLWRRQLRLWLWRRQLPAHRQLLGLLAGNVFAASEDGSPRAAILRWANSPLCPRASAPHPSPAGGTTYSVSANTA